MTTIESNKLIAEFMAGSPVKVHHNMYHITWSELMPVVEKIQGRMIPIDFTHCPAIIQAEIKSSLVNVDKERIYKAVLSFIKWYNKNK